MSHDDTLNDAPSQRLWCSPLLRTTARIHHRAIGTVTRRGTTGTRTAPRPSTLSWLGAGAAVDPRAVRQEPPGAGPERGTYSMVMRPPCFPRWSGGTGTRGRPCPILRRDRAAVQPGHL